MLASYNEFGLFNYADETDGISEGDISLECQFVLKVSFILWFRQNMDREIYVLKTILASIVVVNFGFKLLSLLFIVFKVDLFFSIRIYGEDVNINDNFWNEETCQLIKHVDIIEPRVFTKLERGLLEVIRSVDNVSIWDPYIAVFLIFRFIILIINNFF